MADQHLDSSMPVRDLGSFVATPAPTDADIQGKQDFMT